MCVKEISHINHHEGRQEKRMAGEYYQLLQLLHYKDIFDGQNNQEEYVSHSRGVIMGNGYCNIDVGPSLVRLSKCVPFEKTLVNYDMQIIAKGVLHQCIEPNYSMSSRRKRR